MKPLFFDGLFGFLHPGTKSPGLVVCNPFGYEAVCAQRSLRHFCAAAAAAGFPSLRFDYHGTGDSAGDDREPDRLAAWVKSVHQAVEALKRHGGVERVVLLGVRLGATLATLAATERDDVDSLIAIAPVVAGKPWLREMRALQMSLDLKPPPTGAAVDSDVQEALGFPLTAQTKASITAIDLTKLEKPPAPSVLLLERSDMPPADAWPNHLASQSVKVDRRRLPGYVEMVLGAEHAQVPSEMVRATVEWLHSAKPARETQPTSATTTFGGILERAEFVDGSRIFGILSTPEKPPPSRRGLLLLNAGSVHHIGPNRLYVTLARRWAALGHAVLRMDFSGIGDSGPRPGKPENIVYTDHADDDIQRGIDFLRRQPGVREVHALGLCSGGYNAFKAAVSGLPLDGVLVINPLTFFFKPEQPAETREHELAYATQRYGRRLLSPEAWKKLLKGQVRLDAFAQVMVTRARNLARDRLRIVARRVGIRVGDDLELELVAITRRNVALNFLFAANDPGIALLRDQGGSTVTRLQERKQLGIQIIDGPDHTFTPLWSHPLLTAALAAHFDRLP
jgi:pimeloyl-ACP methyl ester carboxylesterase